VTKSWLKRFLADEDGQDLIEYALLVALIALATIGAIAAVGNALSAKYASMASSIGAS